MRLDDDEGCPWTASTHLVWMSLVVLLTAGLAILVLGIYLSLWIRSKGRSILPLAAFFLTTLLTIAGISADHWMPESRWVDVLSVVSTAIFIASSFLLRREIQRHFEQAQGWKPIIGPIRTLFYSTLYINYCLVPDRIPVEDTLTSLNLSDASDLRK